MTEWNTNTAEWFESFYFLTPCFLQLLYFISFAQQSTGQVAKYYDSATIQCAGTGWDNLYLKLFTAAKTLFWELPYQLRIRFVPGSVPFEESEKHPCVQEMFFSHGNKQDSWLNISFAIMFSPGWESRLQALPNLPYTLFPTRMGSHFLLQGIFQTQGSNSGLLHCRWSPAL